jgi:hypothetical protein
MKFMKFYCIMLIAAISLDCSAQTAASNDDWGEKFDTAGAKLLIKETGRSRIEGQTGVVYELFASGLPLNLKYSLWTRLVGSPPQLAADALLNGEGKVVSQLANAEHDIAEDPINLKVFAGRGEPKQFALISTDGKFRAFAQVVPFPMEFFSGSCHLSAVMTGPSYSGVLIGATGFLSGEDLIVDVRSDGQDIQKQAKATDRGEYETVLLPFVKGKRSGKLRFGIAAKSCEVAIEMPWGEGSYELQ